MYAVGMGCGVGVLRDFAQGCEDLPDGGTRGLFGTIDYTEYDRSRQIQNDHALGIEIFKPTDE